MNRSLLIKVVLALSESEKSRLDSFLTTDLYNKGKSSGGILKLWKIINNHLVLTPERPITKDKVFKKLFPGKEFNLGQLEKLMSKLLHLIYDFIHIDTENSEGKEIKKQINIYRFLMKNGLLNAGQVRSKSIANRLAETNSNTENFYLDLLFQKSITDFESFRNDRKADLNLPACLASLDHFYLFTKLEFTLQLLTVNRWSSPQDTQDAVDKLDYALKEVPELLAENPIFQLYFHAYTLLKDFENSNEAEFNIFQQKLAQYENKCHPAQLKVFQSISRSYCVRCYRHGDKSFIAIGFDLYKKHLEEGLLYYQGKILTGTLNNLVLLANWSGNSEWAKTFIEDHKPILAGVDDPEVVCKYNLAVTAFYEGEYDKALDLLDPSYQNNYLKIASKRLEIMALFELQSPLLNIG